MNILEILKLGSIGLFFLLALLTYRLLANEQKKAEPHKNMITAIYVFMVLCLLFGMAGLFVEPKNNPLLSTSSTCDNTAIEREIALLGEEHRQRSSALNQKYDAAYQESTPGLHIDSYIEGYKEQMRTIAELIAAENESFLQKTKALEVLKCEEVSHNN